MEPEDFAFKYLLYKQEGRFPHSDWLVLVHTSRHAEAQSHAHVLMENHHLHILIVLHEVKAVRRRWRLYSFRLVYD